MKMRTTIIVIVLFLSKVTPARWSKRQSRCPDDALFLKFETSDCVTILSDMNTTDLDEICAALQKTLDCFTLHLGSCTDEQLEAYGLLESYQSAQDSVEMACG